MSVGVLVPMLEVPPSPSTPGGSTSCADELRRSPRPSLAELKEIERLQEEAARCSLAQLAEPVLANALLKFDTNAFGQSFRDYNAHNVRYNTVMETYRLNHVNQTYDFVLRQEEKYTKLQNGSMTVWDACELLNGMVDESDPDLDEPQIEHLLQTAEAIRREFPDDEWFHLVGLIHDLGKILSHPRYGNEPQWAVVGDTFPVGCKHAPCIVHSHFFADNPDSQDERMSSEAGLYEPGCGLDKVHMSWGHDEYMYQVMKLNGCTLPPQAFFIIRYHSFYALHRENAYQHLLNDHDREMLTWLKRFNKFDLYSKSKTRVDVAELKPYYMGLINKYFPAVLKW
ncbi:myo-inositol oxygenase [Klebsormidium nitens]|uniref:Inositol oxygenase n=1 Tax=Klebsormidium nitens TaxID=105231 RepID=A0A0U9HHZ1_KLENI|nr:myo-inositol oxygenase [Klebsormidium nitens]|eukprot:GAQ77566.1 myo-inositol oxygenase [Klebsormidium nitens]